MTPKHLAKFVGADVLVTFHDNSGDDWRAFRVLAVDGVEVWFRGIRDPEGWEHDGSSFVEEAGNVRTIKRLPVNESASLPEGK